MDIFNFFGSILGYLLWFLYTIFGNYGVAIILFALIVKMALFPFTLKSQRSMAGQSKFAEKQKELQKKYANNKALYNQELQKLYEKEGTNPASGCLTSLIPLPIMFGIYYSVIYPLQNTLHIAEEKIAEATVYITEQTSIAVTNYIQLDIIRHWDTLREQLTMFSVEDVEKIDSFVTGFSFLGLDLLLTPSTATFTDFIWIIPALSLISSLGMQILMTRNSPVKQQGCMKALMYALPLMSAYWAWIFPGAVGFYWAISNVIGGLQSVITKKFFSAEHMIARKEAEVFVTLLDDEKKVKPLPADLQKQVAAKIEAQSSAANQNNSKANTDNKKKKNNKNNKSSNDYLGNKK